MQQFCVSLSAGNTVWKLPLSESKNCKIFMVLHCTQTTQVYLQQNNLLSYNSLCSDSSQYAIIFFQSLINADYFTSWITLDILMNVLQD